MAKFSIFLTEKNGDGVLEPLEGASSVYLLSQNAGAAQVALTESLNMPGMYSAEITNPYAKYDLYINGVRQDDFSGTYGFFFPGNKALYTKRNLAVDSDADVTPDTFVTGTGSLAQPDGSGGWPKFDGSNLPVIYVLEPSELSSGLYIYRKIALVKDSVSVDVSGNLTFQLSLDPNGPTLGAYTCDLLIIMP